MDRLWKTNRVSITRSPDLNPLHFYIYSYLEINVWLDILDNKLIELFIFLAVMVN